MTSFSTDTGVSYNQRFEVYREKSGENFKDIEVLQTHLPAAACKILQTSGLDTLNILSIGSGDGQVDYEILKMIKTEIQRCGLDSSKIKIFNRAIEPNKHYIATYESSISKFKELLGDKVTFHLVKSTFEKYLKTKKDTVRFDIIHFVRSIYYVDAEQTLLDCFEKELNNGGKIALVLAGSNDLITHIHQMLWPNGKPIESEPFEMQDVQKIVKIADKHGWNYEVFSLEYSIDVTEILDASSVKGNLLLDFFTHKMNYRETAEEKHLKETLDLIHREVVSQDGKYLGNKSSNIVFFYK